MSIPECSALLERHVCAVERNEFMLAQIAAFIYNFNGFRGPDTEPLPTERLMPSRVLEEMQYEPQHDDLAVIRKLDAWTERHTEMT